MRSTLDIEIAVSECQPATDEELRLAVASLSSMLHFMSKTVDDLIAVILEKPGLAKFKAEFAKGTRENVFKGKKNPMDVWLGPRGIPGSPEQKASLELGKKIFKKATGLDLDALTPSNAEETQNTQ